jgi:hypothetical protein
MKPFKTRYRFALQTTAFLVILISSTLLYLTAESGEQEYSWILFGLLAAAMVLAMWIS